MDKTEESLSHLLKKNPERLMKSCLLLSLLIKKNLNVVTHGKGLKQLHIPFFFLTGVHFTNSFLYFRNWDHDCLQKLAPKSTKNLVQILYVISY